EVGPLVAVERVRGHAPVHVVIEVDVRVDEAGDDDGTARIERAGRAIRALNVGAFADRDDAITPDGHGTVPDEPPRRIHRHDRAATDDEIDRCRIWHGGD